MSEPTREQIIQALTRVVDEQTGAPLVDATLVSGVVVRAGKVGLSLEINPDEMGMEAAEQLRQRAEMAVSQLPGVERATVVLTAEQAVSAPSKTALAQESPAQQITAKKPAIAARWEGQGLDGVKQIIAIASGKGGVGKSTCAVNLAAAATAQGLKVGILDADIYGPSIPTLMGLHRQPEVKDGQFIPLMQRGIACMSMGFITGDDKPVVWRGAMVTKALAQMLRGVKWDHDGELDILFIDMPPGTGDIHLSLAQGVPLSGAVMVSTPQEVALQDALKCLQTFRKLNVPVLGMIENMSYFPDPATGEKHAIFGHGGAREAAVRYHVPFLGEVPIDPALREAGDEGQLMPLTQPESATARVYRNILQQLLGEEGQVATG